LPTAIRFLYGIKRAFFPERGGLRLNIWLDAAPMSQHFEGIDRIGFHPPSFCQIYDCLPGIVILFFFSHLNLSLITTGNTIKDTTDFSLLQEVADKQRKIAYFPHSRAFRVYFLLLHFSIRQAF